MTVGLQLQDGGAFAGAGPGDGTGSGLVDSQNVIAVHHFAGDAVNGGTAGSHVFLAAGQLDGGVGGVEVVFTNIHNRQLPQAGCVHGFMVGAFVGGAVTEEADNHVVLLLHLKCQTNTGSDGQVAAHDSVGYHSAHSDVTGVHGAALAAAAAVGLAEHFTHHALQAHTLCQVMTRGAVGGSHPVVLAEVIQHTYGAGLFTGTLVNGAGHNAFQEQVVDALFVHTDLIHFPVHAKSSLFCRKIAHVLFPP